LALIRFRAEGGGETRLTLTNASATDDNLAEVGSCAPVVDIEMDCEGATITVSGAPVPGVTPGAVITPGTPSPGGGTVVPADDPTAIAAETAVAVETSAAVQTAVAQGTPVEAITEAAGGGASGTVTPNDPDGSRTPSPTRTSATGVTTQDDGNNDEDDGNGATTWIIVGAVAALVVAAGGGAAYWYRYRNRGV
jgi:hypothetical protein